VVEVLFPDAKCREHYLTVKLGRDANIAEWVEKTEGFSIDELKATVLEVKCLGVALDDVLDRILKARPAKVIPVDQEDEMSWEMRGAIDHFMDNMRESKLKVSKG